MKFLKCFLLKKLLPSKFDRPSFSYCPLCGAPLKVKFLLKTYLIYCENPLCPYCEIVKRR